RPSAAPISARVSTKLQKPASAYLIRRRYFYRLSLQKSNKPIPIFGTAFSRLPYELAYDKAMKQHGRNGLQSEAQLLPKSSALVAALSEAITTAPISTWRYKAGRPSRLARRRA